MIAAVLMSASSLVVAHPISFNSTITYSASQPTATSGSISNWTGATFDAANLGGSGVNADGGANNGTANDAYTYVANNQPRQGQTFTTGSNPNGYQLTAVTVRMAGYTNNNATGSNRTSWDLNAHNGPIQVEIGKVNGTDVVTLTKQMFIMGRAGNPGAGTSANGAGQYVTFHLPFTTYLEPNTTYAFDFWVGNGSSNYFEWLGTQNNEVAGGTAYNRAWWGGPITPLAGERVFQAHLTALDAPRPRMASPGTLHTQEDINRMKAKIAAGEQPWLTGYNMLLSSPYNNLGWPAYPTEYIVRGDSGNNYTRSQQDAQLIYTLSLLWHLTGDTAYANRAVYIANVWGSTLKGVTGNTNKSLAAGICGYLFAVGGDLLSMYPGWAETDKQAYKDMMMRVFYPENLDFLWRHHDTPWSKGGTTHYRLNWDTYNMASMAAIGVLCDNRAVYEQAVDYFKYGPGNGRIERAAWYIFPDGMATTEEMGRDQGHNFGGWGGGGMLYLCQTAWNQGDDLFGYDNNRVLRALEYIAKYNLGGNAYYTPWHRNASLTYTESAASSAGRGGFIPMYEMAYHHYVNIKGLAAPYSTIAAERMRPEPWPNTGAHPSQVDWFGHGTLTHSRDPMAQGAVPSGLRAHWSKNRVTLSWWGTARATGYTIKRSTAPGGPYAAVGTIEDSAGILETVFADTDVVNGTAYYYVISAVTPTGETDNSAELAVRRSLVARYTFEGSPDDVVGTRHAALYGGSTGLPTYAPGQGGGQAISLNGVDGYVQLPVGAATYRDVTIAAWVYWNGGANWQRIFDFGSEIEKSMFLTPKSGSNTLRFHITTTRGADGSGTLDGPALPIGQWVHVAVTFNGDVGTLFVNGKPVDTKVIDAVAPLFSQVFCYLGRSMWNADPLFNGRIDDFRIYNYALSGSDVWTLWGGSAAAPPEFSIDPIVKPNAVQSSPYAGQTLSANVSSGGQGLAFSKLSGPSWLTVAPDGTLSGTPANSDAGLNYFVVRATAANGATDDAALYIEVENVNDAPFWRKDTILIQGITQGQAVTGSLADEADDPDLSVDPNEALTFSKAAGPKWLAVSQDGRFFGTPASEDVGMNSFTVRVVDASGAIADAMLTIPVYGFSLRSHYPFNSSLNDIVSGYNGAGTGDALFAEGQLGAAIQLDGADDYVTLPAGVVNYDHVTIAAWVNWNGGAVWQRIFDFGSNTDQTLFLTPRSGSNTLRFAIKNGGGEETVETSQLPAGRWVHVAVTLGGNTARLYVDGELKASQNTMTVKPADFKPSVNYIGKSQWPDPLFHGKIDDFRIYNYALTPSEINWIRVQSRTPYLGVPTAIPGRLEFENFDIGGQLISFYDKTAANGYGAYRPNEPVDIMSITDGGAGFALWTEGAEWIEYTCAIEPGTYTIIVRSSSPYAAQQLTLSQGEQTAAAFTLPNSGGVENWRDTILTNVTLIGGADRILRFTLGNSASVLNYVDFIRQFNPADISRDGRVDMDDAAILAAQWLSAPGQPSADIAPPGGDAAVDSLDLLMLAENWMAND